MHSRKNTQKCHKHRNNNYHSAQNRTFKRIQSRHSDDRNTENVAARKRLALGLFRYDRRHPENLIGTRKIHRSAENAETARRLGFVPADRAVDEADGVFSTD